MFVHCGKGKERNNTLYGQEAMFWRDIHLTLNFEVLFEVRFMHPYRLSTCIPFVLNICTIDEVSDLLFFFFNWSRSSRLLDS